MESNKKRKVAAKEPNEERDQYYKKLRREQNKRRQKRKKASELKKAESLGRAPRGSVEGEAVCTQSKKRIKLDKKVFSRGSILVSAALEKASRKPEKASKMKEPVKLVASCKPSSGENDLKEINSNNVKRDEGKGAIGSGTFGNCYLARYRGLRVVLKEFKERDNTSVEKLRREVVNEARVVQRLGDHPGIPLLFGVMLKQPVVGIIFQFHGEDDRSLTLYKAAKEKKWTEKHVWDRIFREVAGALEHIHSCGFIHNDLKSNNVVSEQREGQPSPVIIDFGKSVLAEKAKVPVAKAKHISSHFSYIAPELRNGTAKPSVSSDIYSLAFMVKSLYKILDFKLNGTVKNALKELSDNRPSLIELSGSLN
ncbi:aurora kinase A-like [Acropora muricata]|uniref:aurora kinase A-like n=1 Tax=Acropora muricata TaxID=159855 RepID=UPI0034E54936